MEKLSASHGWDPVALFFLGGTEKIERDKDLELLGKPVVFARDLLEDFSTALRTFRPGVVVDLSDEPILSSQLRFQLISRSLKEGSRYRGADFEFHPPPFEEVLDKPSISIFGTGKRCGKTAVSAHLARYLREKGEPPVVVTMGRGGPEKPQLISPPPGGISEDFLLREREEGKHAASDHYEDALIAGVTTIGCRRCGGGMAGEPFVSNFVEGAKMANTLGEGLVILEGSGASLPPVRANVNICVASASQPIEEILGYLGIYRLLISDGLIITMCEEPCADPDRIAKLEEGIKSIRYDLAIIKTVFRPFPLKSIEKKKVFFVCTAPREMGETIKDYLEGETGCKVQGWSNHLARRSQLEEDLRRAPDFDILLTELKAAAVDVVVSFARREGKEVVFMHNQPVGIGGACIEGFFEKMLGFVHLKP